MSTVDQVKAEAERLARTITEIKSATEANGGEIAAIKTAVAAVEVAQTKFNQTVDAYNRASFDRTTAGISNRELERYTRAADSEVSQNSDSYLKGQSGAIRLTGHDAYVNPGDPRSRVKRWGYFDDPQPRTEHQREAQRLLDRRNLVAAVMRLGAQPGATTKAYQAEADLVDHLRECPDDRIARIFSDSAGIGAEWIPNSPLPELERDLMFRPARWQIFEQRTMTGPVVLPYKSSYLRPYKGSIPTADDPAADLLSSLTTSDRTIDAEEIVVGAQVSRNAMEDSIIAVEPEIRQDIIDALVWGIEDAITHGDTTASHQDAIASWNIRGRLGSSGLGTTLDHRRTWEGLVKRARSLTSMTSDNGGVALTADLLRAGIRKLHMESLINSDNSAAVVVEVSPETFFAHVIDWDEFDAFDNVGLLASVVTGQLGDLSRTPGGLLPNQVGFLWGRFPVILNYTLTSDLAATGLYTGSGALSASLQYDRSRMQMWIRKGAMVEVGTDIRNNTHTLVGRWRGKFRFKDSVSSTNKTVQYTYNIL